MKCWGGKVLVKPYYEEENITIYHGDCLSIIPTLESVDIVATDPPYNLGRKYTGNYDDNRMDYIEWCRLWFSMIEYYWNCPMVFSVGVKNLPMWYQIKSPDWLFCWFKGNNMGSGSSFTNIGVWEPLLIYGKLPKQLGVDGRIIPIAPQKDTGDHDCPKPLKLMERIIVDFTEPDDLIVDPFLGSGTTTLAAKNLGRRAIGIEIEKKIL